MEGSFIKSMPKIELHAHLNGCIRKSTLQEFLGEMKPQLTQVNELEDAFVMFSQIHSISMTECRLRRIVREVLDDMACQNVRYLELRTTPKHNNEYDQEGYIRIVVDELMGFKGPMQCRLLISLDRARGFQYAQQTLSVLTKICPHPCIVGIDISGHPKASFNVAEYGPIFEAFRSMDLKITAHLGEINTSEAIQEIDIFMKLGISRIGHLCYFTPEQLTKVKQLNISVEICLSSNISTLPLPNPVEHHYSTLQQAGVIMIPCVDDTLLFDTDLTQEITLLQNLFKIPDEDLLAMQQKAVDYIFDEGCKEGLRTLFESQKTCQLNK